MKMSLRASDGAIGVKTTIDPEDCPNGCGPLHRVTERQAGNDLIDRLEASLLHEKELETQLVEARAQERERCINTVKQCEVEYITENDSDAVAEAFAWTLACLHSA
ncbi:MAG: hypothetical protein ACP5QR_04990 [Rhizomicrobium sp.]